MSVFQFYKSINNLLSRYAFVGLGNKGAANFRFFQSLCQQPILNPADSLSPMQPSLQTVRTKIRQHFPRPKEYLRVAKHGWKKRLSTPGGRAIIMRRILKGRYVLSH